MAGADGLEGNCEREGDKVIETDLHKISYPTKYIILLLYSIVLLFCITRVYPHSSCPRNAA